LKIKKKGVNKKNKKKNKKKPCPNVQHSGEANKLLQRKEFDFLESCLKY
jgi:hypothetical protein